MSKRIPLRLSKSRKTGTKFKLRKILTDLLETRLKDKLDFLDVFPKDDGHICRFFPIDAIYRRIKNDREEFPEEWSERQCKIKLRHEFTKMVTDGEVDYISGTIRGGGNLYALRKYKDHTLEDFTIHAKSVADTRGIRRRKNVLDS